MSLAFFFLSFTNWTHTNWLGGGFVKVAALRSVLTSPPHMSVLGLAGGAYSTHNQEFVWGPSVVKSCFKNVLSLSWLRGCCEPRREAAQWYLLSRLVFKNCLPWSWCPWTDVTTVQLFTYSFYRVRARALPPVDMFKTEWPRGWADWERGEVTGNQRRLQPGKRGENQGLRWPAKKCLGENRNLRAAVWQVTLNENGRGRSGGGEWDKEGRGVLRNERRRTARQEKRGRKRSGPQCGTERRHWDSAMKHTGMRSCKLQTRICYAIWDLWSCQCPGSRRKGFDYSSLIILSYLSATCQECT